MQRSRNSMNKWIFLFFKVKLKVLLSHFILCCFRLSRRLEHRCFNAGLWFDAETVQSGELQSFRYLIHLKKKKLKPSKNTRSHARILNFEMAVTFALFILLFGIIYILKTSYNLSIKAFIFENHAFVFVRAAGSGEQSSWGTSWACRRLGGGRQLNTNTWASFKRRAPYLQKRRLQHAIGA